MDALLLNPQTNAIGWCIWKTKPEWLEFYLWISFTFREDIRVLLVHWRPLCAAPYVWLTASQDGCFSVCSFIYFIYLFIFRRQRITFGNRCAVRPVHSAQDCFLTCGSVWNGWFQLALCGRALQPCCLWEMLLIFSWLFTEESQQACIPVKQCLVVTTLFTLPYATCGFPEAATQTIHAPFTLPGIFYSYLLPCEWKLYYCN